MHLFFKEQIMKIIITFIVSLFFPCALAWGNDVSGISFDFTRIVMTDNDKKGVFYHAYNNNPFPILVQSWGSNLDTDTGSVDETAKKLKVPFIVLPPLQRVEPGEKFTLNLRFNGEPVPEKKESVYLLSFKAIPASESNNNNNNKLSMTVVLNIKVFIRSGLPDDGGIVSTLNKLTASWQPDGIMINNPSPYWLTLSSMMIDNKEIDKKELLKMAVPMHSTLFKWNKGKPRDVFVRFIDEYSMDTSPVRLQID